MAIANMTVSRKTDGIRRNSLLIVGFGGCLALCLWLVGNALVPEGEQSDDAYVQSGPSSQYSGVEPWRRFRPDAASAERSRPEPVTPAPKESDPAAGGAMEQPPAAPASSMPRAAENAQLRVSGTLLSDIRVTFKTSHRKNRHRREVWLPNATFTLPRLENQVIVEARAQGLDTNGQMVEISPEWIPASPGMVSVYPSPRGGNAVLIAFHGAGRSLLYVAYQGFSKGLRIDAAEQGSAMRVGISQ